MPRRGMTLTELLLTIMVLTVVMVPIVALFPTSRRTITEARTREVALGLAMEQMNEVLLNFPTVTAASSPTVADVSEIRTTQNGVEFTIKQEIFTIARDRLSFTNEPILVDVVISVSYPGGKRPVSTRNRLYRSSIEMRSL